MKEICKVIVYIMFNRMLHRNLA